MGTTCLLMVAPDEDFERIAAGLLVESEKYLRRMGAKLLYAGCIPPLNPFYLGLYGGSEQPGVLKSDSQMVSFYLEHDYEIIDRCIILHRGLGGFRMPVDRRQMQLKRKYRVEADSQYCPATWWDACTAPPTDTTRFTVVPRDGSGSACGHLLAWSIEPLSHQWNGHAAGMFQVEIDESLQRCGLATFLNGEAMLQLQLAGISLVEVQTMQSNTAALGLYKKLGFQPVDEGLVLRKRA
jgi:ribosomal protein S18 acetylase RimI-like enzyme